MFIRRLRSHFTDMVRVRGTQIRARAEFGDPNAFPRPRREVQNLPHRAMTVSRHAEIKTGDVIEWRGIIYLLLAQHTLAETNKFLAVEAPTFARWSRFMEKIDPVTKMAKDEEEVELQKELPVVFEPRGDIEEEKFSQARYRVFTTSPVQQSDLIDGMKVLEANDLLGLRILVVS